MINLSIYLSVHLSFWEVWPVHCSYLTSLISKRPRVTQTSPAASGTASTLITGCKQTHRQVFMFKPTQSFDILSITEGHLEKSVEHFPFW